MTDIVDMTSSAVVFPLFLISMQTFPMPPDIVCISSSGPFGVVLVMSGVVVSSMSSSIVAMSVFCLSLFFMVL